MKDITFVRLDDWVGVYLDGKCAYQNHSIAYDRLLNLLDIYPKTIFADDSVYSIEGYLPDELSDVKVAQNEDDHSNTVL
jgi:hypothetical protein